MFCFVFVFIFGDFCLLYLSDEFWDHLSSCFQLLRRIQQTFRVDFNLSISVFVLKIIDRWISILYLSNWKDANFVEELAFQDTKS